MNMEDVFNRFAIQECKGSSRLYEFLSSCVAEDEELLQLASHAQKGQPVPNLFFGSIHYLLLSGKEHDLKYFYRSLVEQTEEPESSFVPFKDFCLTYSQEIIEILQSKFVQTNEVRRCSYLYPSFSYIYQLAHKPLSLIEIGTSSGINLFWDCFKYDYLDGKVYGKSESGVRITSELKGDKKPLLMKSSPPVILRIGIDLHIVDLNDPEHYRWLTALIWPDHKERLQLFKAAAASVKIQKPLLVEGNGIELLDSLVETAPIDSTLCIYHTHVANQMSKEERKNLLHKIEKIAENRDVFHLYNNIYDGYLHLDYYVDKMEYKLVLAETDGHGRWFKWLL